MICKMKYWNLKKEYIFGLLNSNLEEGQRKEDIQNCVLIKEWNMSCAAMGEAELIQMENHFLGDQTGNNPANTHSKTFLYFFF